MRIIIRRSLVQLLIKKNILEQIQSEALDFPLKGAVLNKHELCSRVQTDENVCGTQTKPDRQQTQVNKLQVAQMMTYTEASRGT